MADDPAPLRFLPIGLKLEGRSCLVVGGGEIGTRKVLNLLRAGADVTVVSPEVTGELAELIARGEVRWIAELFRDDHLDGVFLAIVATDDETRNAEVVDIAKQYGTLICDASSSERSQVIFGALHQSDGTTIAVFTDGRDPAGARRTRDHIAGLLDSDPEA